MKKPSFETIDDQKREERVAGYLEGAWDVTCHKLPTTYGLDYWIESKDKCFWCEVKCRTFSFDKYDTFILSVAKLMKGAMLCTINWCPIYNRICYDGWLILP